MLNQNQSFCSRRTDSRRRRDEEIQMPQGQMEIPICSGLFWDFADIFTQNEKAEDYRLK